MPEPTPANDSAPCPNCRHSRHLPGTECEAVIDHGRSHWHRCLCLARPGAALPCPPQMTCQGGTLGYSDIWYLQHGHSLWSADGVVSPEVLRLDPTRSPTAAPSDASLTPAGIAWGTAFDRANKAEAAIERVRKALAERRTEVAEFEAEYPPSAWSDAATVTCDRIDDALRELPTSVPCEPGPADA